MSGKIMVVDDTTFIRNILKDIFRSSGYEVVAEASDGAEAVHLYRQLKPDLVTLDLTLPGVNGLQAMKEIKAFDPKAKIVICSAVSQQQMVIEAIEAGAKDFIVKPVMRERLIEVVETLLA
jgi:two-component system chemotaxis response regulator CheY